MTSTYRQVAVPEQGSSPVLAIDDLVQSAPGELYVLTLPDGRLELRRTPRGDVLACAFSSFELLAESCGTGQPWVRLDTAELERVADALGVTLIALDARLPDGHRYPEPVERDQPELPAAAPVPDGRLVYLPARPFTSGDPQAVLELQPDARGRTQLLAYTSAAELASGCGPHQAWVAVAAARLPAVAEQCGAYRVLFNPVLAVEARHTGPVVNWNVQ